MTKLFDKYAPLQARVDMMMKMGSDALGVEFDDILSATRGRIGNREILLAGTNNYLGRTFWNAVLHCVYDRLPNQSFGYFGPSWR